MPAMTDAMAVGIWGFITAAATMPARTIQNKVPEYRITVRPLPDFLPGFQATYFGLYGKGNSSSATQFWGAISAILSGLDRQQGYLSYQHPWFILTAQMFSSKGNQAGIWTTQTTRGRRPSAPGPTPCGPGDIRCLAM